ncbi:MAG TPA: 4Fe-4S dicluster domain-containing protein [Ignavibacteriaceae bacterium]
MAIKITDECINCDACRSECPNNAIYEPGDLWRYADGTGLKGVVGFPSGVNEDTESKRNPLSEEFYYIVSDKCTECKGFHEEPQCAAVCPVDCCVPDENHVESDEVLLARKKFLHL